MTTTAASLPLSSCSKVVVIRCEKERNLHCLHSEDFIDFAMAHSDGVPNPQGITRL